MSVTIAERETVVLWLQRLAETLPADVRVTSVKGARPYALTFADRFTVTFHGMTDEQVADVAIAVLLDRGL